MDSASEQSITRGGIVAGWNRFFFAPADPRPLAAVRIAVGLLMVWSWTWLAFDLHDFLGSRGWASAEVAQAQLRPGAWSLWFAVPDSALGFVWAVGLITMICLTVGFGTQVSAWIAWAFVASTMRRSPVTVFGFDNILTIWAFYLAACFASGQAFSVDRWLKTRRFATAGPPQPSVAANLGLRLMQIHLCLIYASAGLAKLQGAPWWDGSAVGMLLGNSEFRPFDLGFLAEHPRLLELATHATVAFELLYPVLIWIRGWRPWLLAGAVAMHLGIALAMGLTEFSLVMLAGNLAFLPASWFDGFAKIRGRRSADARVESIGSEPVARQPAPTAPARRGDDRPRRKR